MPSQHEFRGTSTRPRQKRRAFSQASTRRPMITYDQHGRMWHMQVGLKSGMPVGLITPGFGAPWQPDHQYLVVNVDNPSEMWIDYGSMLASRHAQREAFHKRALQWAAKNQRPAPRKDDYSDELVGALGSPPRFIQPIVAAMQENAWILGMTFTEDARVSPYVQRSSAADTVLEEFDFRTESFAQAKERTAAATRAVRSLAGIDLSNPDEMDKAMEAFTAEGVGSDDDEDAVDEDALLDEITDETEPGAEDDDEEDDELEEAHDAEQLGGRRVPPQQAERAKGQAPRRGAFRGTAQTEAAADDKPLSKGTFKDQRAAQREGRATLASGATPAIGGLTE